jgi:transcription termination/antitermination protein NusG
VEEPDRSAGNAAPEGDAAPAQPAAEHPVAPDEATMVPAEASHPDIEQREMAADTTAPEAAATDSANKLEAAEQAAYEGTDEEGGVEEDEGFVGPAEPLEFIDESVPDEDLKFDWYILKVAVNREDSIKEALLRRVKMNGLEKYFHDVVVPTEDVKEFTKTGKARVVKKKLYPGYILINMSINDESWFVVRETPGIGDFTGAGGKPSPMLQKDVDRILKLSRPIEEGPGVVKTAIPFKKGDRVRVKEGYFQNFEGDVDVIDEANGRVTVLVNIFGRSAPVELDHWQIENV